jgi:hypothetical protein
MPIHGGIKTVNYNTVSYDSNGRITHLKVSYRTNYGTYFEMDGDIIRDRKLEAEGSLGYIKD